MVAASGSRSSATTLSISCRAADIAPQSTVAPVAGVDDRFRRHQPVIGSPHLSPSAPASRARLARTRLAWPYLIHRCRSGPPIARSSTFRPSPSVGLTYPAKLANELRKATHAPGQKHDEKHDEIDRGHRPHYHQQDSGCGWTHRVHN